MVLEMSVFTAMSLELSYQEFKQRYLRVHVDATEGGDSASNEINREETAATVVVEESKQAAASSVTSGAASALLPAGKGVNSNSKFYKKE